MKLSIDAPVKHQTPNTKHQTPKRRGFTLVELVVVLAIILVLVGLISAAVRVALVKGAEVRNRNDIMQLEIALQAFKTQFGFYPPSQLKLCDKQTSYGTSTLDVDSQYYLQTMFPRLTWPVDWNSNNNYDTAPATLSGDQCLVWFLGGPTGVSGFSTNPVNPMAPGGSRIGPFFEFQVTRLVALSTQNSFLSYIDAYKQQPFLYFSAGKSPNGYNRYNTVDCQIGGGVWPYAQGNGQYWKPNSYQIISAGRNGVFCTKGFPAGLVYTPGNATKNTLAVGADGKTVVGIVDVLDSGVSTPSDDQANFATGLLGGGN